MPRLARIAITALLAGAALAGCGSANQLPESNRPAPRARLASGPPAHVAVIVMENEEYGDLLSAPGIPFIRHLAATGAVAGQMYSITHPSLPNYLALTT